MTGPGERPAVSVIVCTYNRADSLRHTLTALGAQVVPPDWPWELVVVDNNSTDHTRTVVERGGQNVPQLRYVFEPQQGLSHARNAGIRAAAGKLLLFTDDDVRPEPNWIQTTVTALEREQADGCGGYIAPDWETPPPAWLTERFFGFLAVKVDTRPYLIEHPGQLPFGANMAIRRRLIDQHGDFDVHRGRRGNQLASGEDSELFTRFLAAGAKLVYVPESRVHHRIEAFRTRKSYFRRWRRQTSHNLARTLGVPASRRIGGIPPYLVVQTLRAGARALTARFTKPAPEAFAQEMILWHFFGTLHGLWQDRHQPIEPPVGTVQAVSTGPADPHAH